MGHGCVVGVVGMGVLGKALAKGLVNSPGVTKIVGTSKRGNLLPELPTIEILRDNRELAIKSDVIVFCVKPSDIEAVVRETAPSIDETKLVIVAVGGTPTSLLESWLGDKRIGVVRAVINLPFSVGEGMTLVARGNWVTNGQSQLAQLLFRSSGQVVEISEDLLNAATAISACGPAYMCSVLEGLIDGGVKLGLPRDLARVLAIQTMLGSARLAVVRGAHPAVLRDDIATPAGATIEGLIKLEEGQLRLTLLSAVVAAAERCSSLVQVGD